MIWVLLLAAAALTSDHWPQFRGPSGAGIAEDPRLPDRWSETENVAWKIGIPGLGWSSPIVWGDRVFVTSVTPMVEQEKPRTGIYLDGRRTTPPPGEHRWMLYCIDVSTGKRLWEHEVHRGEPKSARHLKNSFASETPVTDGERIYAYFGNVGVFAFDMDGNALWSRRFGPFPTRTGWGTAASPVLHGNRLFIGRTTPRPSSTATTTTRCSIADFLPATTRGPAQRSMAGYGWIRPLVPLPLLPGLTTARSSR